MRLSQATWTPLLASPNTSSIPSSRARTTALSHLVDSSSATTSGDSFMMTLALSSRRSFPPSRMLWLSTFKGMTDPAIRGLPPFASASDRRYVRAATVAPVDASVEDNAPPLIGFILLTLVYGNQQSAVTALVTTPYPG